MLDPMKSKHNNYCTTEINKSIKATITGYLKRITTSHIQLQ